MLDRLHTLVYQINSSFVRLAEDFLGHDSNNGNISYYLSLMFWSVRIHVGAAKRCKA
jgi:hypothetical protein